MTNTRTTCPRHGEDLDDGRCWECQMERDEARRDLDESCQAAEFKMGRDRREAFSALTLRNMARSAR